MIQFQIKKAALLVSAMSLAGGIYAQQSLSDGIKMYNYERYQTAKNILMPLATGDAKANYYLGITEVALGNLDAAKAIFQKFPEDNANISGLARVEYAKGNAAEGARLAKSVADKAKKKDWEPLMYAAGAIATSENGDVQQAITWYEQALLKNDNNDIRIALGDAYRKLQTGGGKAMNNYEAVVAKDPKNSLALSRIGSLWYDARNYQLALDNYVKAKDADPENPLPWRDLANAYFYTGKYDLAKQNIDKYLELSDKNADDKISWANIHFLAKDYEGAEQMMQELIGQGVQKPYMYRILGYSQFETKKYPEAEQNMQLFFAKQDPKRILPSDYLYYAKILNELKKIDSSNYYYNKAVDADTATDKSEIYRQIAESNKDAKNFKQSAEWYSKIIKANPKASALDYFWWGAMHYYDKDYQNAAIAFEQMAAQYPDEKSAIYWRGRTAAAADPQAKGDGAVEFYKAWLEKVGENHDKKNDLMQAYQWLALHYYNKSNKTVTNQYLDKIFAIDPNDAFAKDIKARLKDMK